MDTLNSLSISDITVKDRLPTLQQYALQYAANKYKVLPLWWLRADHSCACPKHDKCESAGKHPVMEHGLLQATSNCVQVEKWWHDWPQAHVGIRTGAASGVDVLTSGAS